MGVGRRPRGGSFRCSGEGVHSLLRFYAEAGGRIWGAAAGAEESTVGRATGLFASIFAAFYLLWEVVMKLLSSILPKSYAPPNPRRHCRHSLEV